MKEVFENIKERLKEKENEAVLKAPNTSDLSNKEYQKWMMKSYGFKDAIEIVNQVEEEFNQSLANNNQSLTNDGWIPCSEKLPEPNTLVLVSTDAGKIDTDYYGAYLKGFIGLKGTGQKAIAWRPLPAPYKGE